MLLGTEKHIISPRRLLAVLLTLASILSVFSVRLYYLQIIKGEEYAKLADAGYKTTISIAASRGEILDRNQLPLVSNRTSYAVVLDYNYFPRGNGEEQAKLQNDTLLSLVTLLQQRGESWNDSLPISQEVPYVFDEERQKGIASLKSYLRMADYATAEQCLAQMIELYALEAYAPEQQRILAGIRYEMVSAGFGATTPYTFAGDVSKESVYRIQENSDMYPGVDVETVPVREYVAGTTACHIIGTVGPIYAGEYDELKYKGYSYNDTLGKSGIEAAAESYLRGTAGKRVLTKNSRGVVQSEVEEVSPKPGQTVILSLDSKVQAAAQTALTEKMADLRANATKGNGGDAVSGSVVMLDVKNGGVMTCASWPDYNLANYSKEYEQLVANKDKPLFNRALHGAYACGSTFKPGVALAAITEGYISPGTAINCTQTYMYYAPSYTPKCMGYHGPSTVVKALEKSCNYYFYDVGRLMGSSLFSYLTQYGFGQTTGVELAESAGIQQSPDYMKSIGATWVGGDYLQLAIGQRGSYTPMQLAAYTMMIANNGVRYKTHFISAVREFGATSDTVIQPEVAAMVTWSDAAMRAVKEGMIAVGASGTAARFFSNAPYTVACKTGTAQLGIKDASDHGTFIAYAPADNPEVAIAVVMERGTSAASSWVARQVLDAYFDGKDTGEKPTDYGVLLP